LPAHQLQAELVAQRPQGFEQIAGERLAAEVEPVVEADVGIETRAIERNGQFRMGQRVGEGEQGVEWIFRRAAERRTSPRRKTRVSGASGTVPMRSPFSRKTMAPDSSSSSTPRRSTKRLLMTSDDGEVLLVEMARLPQTARLHARIVKAK
jgi:hypothetical protein